MPARQQQQQHIAQPHEHRPHLMQRPVVRILLLVLGVSCAVMVTLSTTTASLGVSSSSSNATKLNIENHHHQQQQQQQQLEPVPVSISLLLPDMPRSQKQQQQDSQLAAGPVRVFIDEGYFLEGDTEILRAYIAASQGRIDITGESTAAFLSVKGYYVPDKWDVYFTIRQACYKVFKHMTAGKLVNCLPGVQAMALKRDFIQTWQRAFGEAAFHYIPRSYLLPEQYWLWCSYINATQSPATAAWVLKANLHRGQGVKVVQQQQALMQARLRSSSSSSSSSSNEVTYHNILVQRYLEPHLLVGGGLQLFAAWQAQMPRVWQQACSTEGGWLANRHTPSDDSRWPFF